MYVPEQRVLRLVEIQESVLPEEEWIIGVSDLGYFKGVGFSMPIPFDAEYFTSEDPMLMGRKGVSDIHHDFDSREPLQQVERCDIMDNLLTFSVDWKNEAIVPSDGQNNGGVHLEQVDDFVLFDSMDRSVGQQNLYAFLPGLFYCSSQHASVDAILVEVTQKELFGMTLTSFRPEDVRSFDVSSGIAVDETGRAQATQISIENLGTFGTDISSKLAEQYQPTSYETASFDKMAINQELEVAQTLSRIIPIDDLKKAYVSGAILAGRLMTLLHDIGSKGLKPRFRIYIRNQKYPNGKIINARYRKIDGILTLESRTGIECPDELDIGIEIQKLSFSKLAGAGQEVDMEQAILDMYEFLNESLGAEPSKEEILDLIFSR